MRKIPGAPELAQQSGKICDNVVIYRARHAGFSALDWARIFPDSTYRWRAMGFPEASARVMAARATLEDQASLRPGSYLLSISSHSDQAAGFRWQLTDRGNAQSISSDWMRDRAGAGAPGKFALRGGPLWLMSPWPVSGLLLVQITNLAAVANRVQLLFQFAEPLK